MPQPDIADLHVNVPLTNVSIGYRPSGFFATSAFPAIPVDKQTDIYPKYNKSFWARDLGAPGAAPTGAYAVRRAPGTRARVAGYTVDTTNTYRCINYALGIEIADELRANADAVWNLDRDGTELLTALLNLRFDREFIADFIDAGVYGSLSISTKWDVYASSTPIEDVRATLQTIRRATLGMSADGGMKILMGALVYQRLLDHPDIIERIKYGGSPDAPAIVTPKALAALFDVDEIKVGKSVYTSDEEGGTAEASITYSDVMSDDILVYWTPRGPSLLAPSAGYLFNWRPLTGGGLTYVRKGREDRPRYDWIEVHANLDWVATETGAGTYNADACD